MFILWRYLLCLLHSSSPDSASLLRFSVALLILLSSFIFQRLSFFLMRDKKNRTCTQRLESGEWESGKKWSTHFRSNLYIKTIKARQNNKCYSGKKVSDRIIDNIEIKNLHSFYIGRIDWTKRKTKMFVYMSKRKKPYNMMPLNNSGGAVLYMKECLSIVSSLFQPVSYIGRSKIATNRFVVHPSTTTSRNGIHETTLLLFFRRNCSAIVRCGPVKGDV